MIKYLDEINLTSLNLMASTACNLQCEYCLIAKREQKLHTHDIYKNTCQALEDGTYLKNITKVLERLHQNYDQIDELEIWGQEPTMILPHFSAHIKDWFETFSNLDHFNFSTNIMLPNWSDIMYDFITQVDTNVKHGCHINIQLSFDSIGSYLARGGDNEIMLNNILTLLDKLNQTQLVNTTVNLSLHTVISMALINKVNEDEQYVKDFLDSVYYFNGEIAKKLINRNITFAPFGIQYQNGFNATSEDGYNFRIGVEKIEHYAQQHKKEYEQYIPWVNGCITFPMIATGYCGRHLDEIAPQESKSLEDFIEQVLEENSMLPIAQHGLFCFSITSQLKIMYDGTHVPCQNYIYDGYFAQNNLTLPEDTLEDKIIKQAMKKQSINFLTASDDEISTFLDYDISFTQKKAFIPFMSIVASKMIQLAEAGQISRKYLWDMRLLVKHAFLIAINQPCHYNHMLWSGSIYNISFAEIRFVCNAIVPFIEEDFNTIRTSAEIERFSSLLVPAQSGPHRIATSREDRELRHDE